MREVFEGRCQCGAATYRVKGTVITLFVCHCTECQRQSASAFGMAPMDSNRRGAAHGRTSTRVDPHDAERQRFDMRGR